MYQNDKIYIAGHRGLVGSALQRNLEAKGYTNLQGAIEDWMESSGHRGTLLSHRFVEFGLAVARGPGGKLYWAMIAGGSFQAWIGG